MSVYKEVTSDCLANIWATVKSGYMDCNVFNADETGLFYQLTPDKTLKFRNGKCIGGQLSKEEVTVLVGGNADESEKRLYSIYFCYLLCY